MRRGQMPVSGPQPQLSLLPTNHHQPPDVTVMSLHMISSAARGSSLGGPRSHSAEPACPCCALTESILDAQKL